MNKDLKSFRRSALLVICLALLSFSGQQAWGILLEKPIDCQIGKNCFIQNYVDLSPGPEAADHECGPLTYDKHKGTDFRIDYDAMIRGVKVLAAAPGVVRGVRDSMMDIVFQKENAVYINGRECGNGVIIQHPDGSQTKYCHMRRGSIRVKLGEQVSTGQMLGLVGLSGETEFPHLHFEVLVDGAPVCPFTGRYVESGCGDATRSLWTSQALMALPYIASGALGAAFTESSVKDFSVLLSISKDSPVQRQSSEIFFLGGFLGSASRGCYQYARKLSSGRSLDGSLLYRSP